MAEPAKKKPGGLPGSIRSFTNRLPNPRRISAALTTETRRDAVPRPAVVARPQKKRAKAIPVEQILAEMNPDFYQEDFDMSRHVLERIEQLDQPSIDTFRTRKYRELEAVTARLSELVTKNKGEFLRELERVTTLEQDLTKSTALCQAERKHIAHAEMSVKRDLAILYKYRKKTRMEAMLQCADALLCYKTARENIERKLDQPKDAVDVWLNLSEKTLLFESFSSVGKDSADYIKDLRAVIEEKLERTLKLQCSSSYQQEKYNNVIGAYKALDMYADAIDKVQYNFSVIVPSLVRATIVKILGGAEELKGVPFKDVLRRVPLSLFEDCLVEVCRAVCRIMLIFSRIFSQHKKELRATLRGHDSTPATPAPSHRRTRSLTNASDSETVVPTATVNASTAAGAGGAAAGPSPSGAFAPLPGTPLQRVDSVDLNASINGSFSAAPAAAAAVAAAVAAASLPADPVSKKFESTRERIWQDVQKQVVAMLASQDISTLKLSVFLRILGHIRRLVEIGEDFSKTTSTLLNDATRTRTLGYVLGHHRRTLERGKTFLEKDTWVAEIIPANFNLFNLKEYSFLRTKKLRHGSSASSLADSSATSTSAGPAAAAATAPLPGAANGKGGPHSFGSTTAPLGSFDAAAGTSAAAASATASAAAAARKDRERSPLEKFQTDQDMFHNMRNAPEDADVALPEFEDVKVEQAGAESAGKGDKGGDKNRVHCSRSSLYFVRCFGRYLNMMDVLKPIAGEVFACLKELFDYYLHAVVAFFGDKAYLSLLEPKPRALYLRLEAAIGDKPVKRAEASGPVPTLPPGVSSGSAQLTTDRMMYESGVSLQELGPPRINPDIADQLASMPALLGLPCRITGAESLTFMTKSFSSLLAHIKKMIPEEPIKSYASSTIEVVVLLKWFIYKSNSLKLFSAPLADLASEMERMKWDIRDMRQQHSAYIENLDKALGNLKGRLSSFSEAMVPQSSSNLIWTEILTQINNTIVDGFAMAKKCSLEGRALMQVDYRQLLLKIRTYTNVRCQSEQVEDYIRAFYLNDDELEKWIEEHHKTYTAKQLFSLISIGTTPRKNKPALQKRIEDLKGEQMQRPFMKPFAFP